MVDYQGICDHEQTNGPVKNNAHDEMIADYNMGRPCVKEYYIYQRQKDIKNDDFVAPCKITVRPLYISVT